MARTTTEHAIVIRAAQLDGVIRREYVCDEAITPGELLDIAAGLVGPHAAAAGVLPGKMIADVTLTPDTDANPTSAAIDIDIASGDTVTVIMAQPGDVLPMFLANGETAVSGVSQMESDGAGALTVATVGAGTLEGSTVGVADEDLANATGSRIRLRVRIT